ncbi:MAG TPA: type II secretion system F family protein [bacterium]|nr:type II secretion system F family protein [bacterium]
MKYRITALDPSNKQIELIEDASSEQELKKKLLSKSIYPVSIENIENEKNINPEKKIKNLKVSKKELKFFSYQMRLLLKAGLPVDYAIDNLKKHKLSGDMTGVISELHKSVLSGVSISSFMEKRDSIFPPYFTGLAKSGELTGRLGESFGKIYLILEQEISLKNKIISILVYPALLIFLSVVFFIFMISYILPNITIVFDELNAELPAITRWVISLTEWFNEHIILIVLLIAVSGFIFIKIRKTRFYKLSSEKIKLKIPGLNGIYMRYLLINFTDIIGSLLANNAPFLTSVEIAFKSPGSLILNSFTEKTLNNLKSGKSFSNSLDETKFFPDLFVKLADTGEKTKNLPEIFLNLNSMYKEELETNLKTFTSIIEPAIMTVIGAIITFLILSVITPIMKLRS